MEYVLKMRSSTKCDKCGRFHSGKDGSAWQIIYAGHPPEPFDEVSRCSSCVEKHGGFSPQRGIKSEYDCGIVDREDQ